MIALLARYGGISPHESDQLTDEQAGQLITELDKLVAREREVLAEIVFSAVSLLAKALVARG